MRVGRLPRTRSDTARCCASRARAAASRPRRRESRGSRSWDRLLQQRRGAPRAPESSDRRAGPPRRAATPSSACSGLLTAEQHQQHRHHRRGTRPAVQGCTGHVERRIAPAEHEHGRHRRRDEHHGDEDEVGDDGVERAERDEHGRQHRLRRDRPGRRAEPRMHRGRTGREQRRPAPWRNTAAAPASASRRGCRARTRSTIERHRRAAAGPDDGLADLRDEGLSLGDLPDRDDVR